MGMVASRQSRSFWPWLSIVCNGARSLESKPIQLFVGLLIKVKFLDETLVPKIKCPLIFGPVEWDDFRNRAIR